MIDNWRNRQKNNLVSIDMSINMTDIKNSKEDSYSVQKKLGMIEVEKKSSLIEIMQKEDDIERQKNNNKKDDLIMERTTCIENKGKNPNAIEIIQKKNLDIIEEDKEKGMIRKGIVKKMLEKIERQNDIKIEAIRKKLDIKRDIERERRMSILVELVNKGWTNNSPKKNDSLKEKN